MGLSSMSIAAFQGRAIYGDVPQSLGVIRDTVAWAENKGVDILCFPECFLQGYLLDEVKASEASVALNSTAFRTILESFKTEHTTIILGLIEREENKIYNTAVVIERGEVLGKYRKRHLLTTESIFTPGGHSPIFEKKGFKYGINICYDARFPEAAKSLANKGAGIIFYPLNNRLPHDVAARWKEKHIQNLIERAKETACWVVSADVVEESVSNTGYGCTAIVSPQGQVVEQVEYLKQKILHVVVQDFESMN